MVDPALEPLQCRHRHQRRQLAQPATTEFLAEEAGEHGREPFRGLQGDVADEAVANHDIGRAAIDVGAFDVAVKVESTGAQQFGGVLDDLVALDFLLADVEQAHRRAIDMLDGGHQHRTHDAELHQMLGRAIDVGAEIEHIAAAARRRQDGRDRGPVDARQHLQHEAGDRHQGAGVAGRDRGLGVAGLDQIDRHPHRRVLLAAQRVGRRLVHFDDLAGHLHAQAVTELGQQRRHERLQRIGTADQNGRGIGIGPQVGRRGRHRDRRAVVAAHAVDGNRDVR